MAGPEEKKPPAHDEEKPTLASESLEAEARTALNEKDFELLKMIAVSIGQDGMTVQEACMLVNVSYDHFKEQAIKFPVIQRIIDLKELEYKRSLMKSISRKARNGDDKLATYLLETRYPEEFGKKKGGGDTLGADLLHQAISHIQEHGDSDSLIKRKRSVIVTPVHQPAGAREAVRKLEQFLV